MSMLLLLLLIPACRRLESLTAGVWPLLLGRGSALGGGSSCWKMPSSPGKRRVAASRKFLCPFSVKPQSAAALLGREVLPPPCLFVSHGFAVTSSSITVVPGLGYRPGCAVLCLLLLCLKKTLVLLHLLTLLVPALRLSLAGLGVKLPS